MKFYIFADDNDIINATVKNSKFSSDNYPVALEMFNIINKSYRYANSYLIVDFEYKHSGAFGYESLEDLKNCVIVPFLIIREFHYNKNTMECNASGPDGRINENLTIRHDSIVIESSGFAQEFNNNEKALDKFLYCIDNGIPASMNLMFIDNKIEDGKVIETPYKRKIASSIEVLRGKAIGLKKIKINKNQKIIKYEIPKYQFYNFTFEPNNNEIAIGGTA